MHTPLAIVRSALKMLPRLTAEESIMASNRMLVGSGAASPEDARAMHRDWSRDATPPRQQSKAKATPKDLSAIGIDYQVVERPRGD